MTQTVDLTALAVGDLVTTTRTKVAPITCGGPLNFFVGSVDSPLLCPFHPSAFGDNTSGRVNLVLHLGPDEVECLQRLDEAVLAKLQEAPERLGKNVTAESIQLLWRGCVKEWATGVKSARLKVSMPPGAHAVRCWSPEGEQVDMPADMAKSSLCARVWARRVWVTAAGIGLLLEATDLMLASAPSPVRSPWGGA
jgi:hypothetical protein